MREKIARIIDPGAFGEAKADPLARGDRVIALAKADLILSALPIQPTLLGMLDRKLFEVLTDYGELVRDAAFDGCEVDATPFMERLRTLINAYRSQGGET